MSSGRPDTGPAGTSKDTDTKGLVGADLEQVFFERHEAKNWSIHLFPNAGRWSIRLNPVSFCFAVLLIWGFAAWCMIRPEKSNAELGDVQLWVTFTFSWLIMGLQNIFVVFLVALFASKLGALKLGQPDDKPDFPTASWFMMMFSAGIGIGLFFFGVAEPINHYEPCYADPFAGTGSECYGNRYAHLPDNERAQWAINLTFFHWGLHAWSCYSIVGICLGVMVYRKGLTMTMKSAFYPILKDKIYSWIGDMIDVLSVATTLFGVCTSLGLGVKQLNAGLNRLNPDISVSDNTQTFIIWVITLLATISVVSGVKMGIRRISEVNFVLGQILLTVMLFQEDTWYLLNSVVQSIGFYLQNFVQLGTHTDAFEMGPAETVFDEDNDQNVHFTSLAPDGTSAGRQWYKGWTLFYYAWWVSWSPFVGMFIAKISRGRTVRQVILGSLMGPALYTFVWFAMFGSAGLRMERQAANFGLDCSMDEPMVELAGRQWWRLSCRDSTEMWFDLFSNYPMSKFYWGVSMASLILYFVTSSDSGSLVIDCLTANGNPHPPVFQRVFWSVTEGAVANALLKAGGEDGLQALQAVAIIAGLPYTIVVCTMMYSLWSALSQEYDLYYGIEREIKNRWATGLIDVLDYPTSSTKQVLNTLLAIVAPFKFSGAAKGYVNGGSGVPYMVVGGVMFYGWVLLLALNSVQPGLYVIAWLLYLGYTLWLGVTRSSMRELRNIEGNMLIDILGGIIAYPFVAVQLSDEAEAASVDSQMRSSDDDPKMGAGPGKTPAIV
eukprot:jgi/Ulvmu1/7090/UM033_0151.1